MTYNKEITIMRSQGKHRRTVEERLAASFLGLAASLCFVIGLFVVGLLVALAFYK